MNAENAIEKLQRMAREEEMLRSEHKWKQEEEMELLKKTKVKEELRRTSRGVEYSVVGYKVIATFIIIFEMCRREGV